MRGPPEFGSVFDEQIMRRTPVRNLAANSEHLLTILYNHIVFRTLTTKLL